MAFAEADRKRVAIGTVLTVLGGICLAGFRGMGFVLRSLFGGSAYGLFAIAQSAGELLSYLLLGGLQRCGGLPCQPLDDASRRGAERSRAG